MAKQTWDANRIGGGTYEFSQDAQGNYALNSVGFQKLGKLNLSNLGVSTTQTTKDTTKDTAAVSKQTAEAFGDVKPFYYDQTGKDERYTTEYEMKKGGDLATDKTRAKEDTFAQARQAMTSDAAYRGVTPSSRQPGFEVSDTLERGAPISAVDKARKTAGTFTSKIDDPKSMDYGMQISSPQSKVEYSTTRPSSIDTPMVSKAPYQDAIMRSKKGIKYEKPDISQKVTQLTQTALKAVKTASNTLASVVGFAVSKSPIGLVTTVLGKMSGKLRGIDPETGKVNTQAQYEANRDAQNKQNRTNRMVDRISKGKPTRSDPRDAGGSPEQKDEISAAIQDKARSQQGGGGTGCFLKGTQVTMFDGSTKPVEQVDLGDNVAKGGKVFATGKFLIDNLYDYKGIKVSGSHMVNEDSVWMRVRDTKNGKSLGSDENIVYVFGSENRRILINGILFTDYFEVNEQDKLTADAEDFFNNWQDYGNNVDKNNVNTLNIN